MICVYRCAWMPAQSKYPSFFLLDFYRFLSDISVYFWFFFSIGVVRFELGMSGLFDRRANDSIFICTANECALCVCVCRAISFFTPVLYLSRSLYLSPTWEHIMSMWRNEIHTRLYTIEVRWIRRVIFIVSNTQWVESDEWLSTIIPLDCPQSPLLAKLCANHMKSNAREQYAYNIENAWHSCN